MKQSQSRVMKHVHSWQRIKRFAINGLINVHQIGTKFHERHVSSFHFLVLIINFKFLHKKTNPIDQIITQREERNYMSFLNVQ